MLTLTRKKGQKIHIGDAVLTIIRVRRNRVSVSIDAPRDVVILRQEIVDGRQEKTQPSEFEPKAFGPEGDETGSHLSTVPRQKS